MAKRTKQTAWHKRKQKLISSTLLKPHHNTPSDEKSNESSSAPQDRKKIFVKDLLRKIRAAVREGEWSPPG